MADLEGAVLDGSKAVRGGIPVVFPCFGPPERRYRNTVSRETNFGHLTAP